MTLKEHELYELTKPSFIQNVNFSTEAKHRDVLESLIQGRVGKINSGSEPAPPTLPEGKYRVSIASSEYFFGHFKNDTMYIYGLTANERANVYSSEDGACTRDTSFNFAKGKFETACAEYSNVSNFVIENKAQTEILADLLDYILLPLE